MTTNTIRRVTYYHATVKDQPGEAYQILNQLAEMGINLLALTVIPIGPHSTQMTIFPEDGPEFASITRQAGLAIQGPFQAILVQGNDEVGALSEVHKALYHANVNVYASSGVSDGKGSFGYLIYVRPEAFDRAAETLGI
jgi:hypothetical protein